MPNSKPSATKPRPLVFTFVGADQPGLVQLLAETVAAHGGNWLESRMSELAGQFAGIVKAEVAPAKEADLRAALSALSTSALSLVLAGQPGETVAGPWRYVRLHILGNDRPGIVREVAHALAARQINVREMDTSITSAPMSGELLFEAAAHIQLPQSQDLEELTAQLDLIAVALSVDIDLEEIQV